VSFNEAIFGGGLYIDESSVEKSFEFTLNVDVNGNYPDDVACTPYPSVCCLEKKDPHMLTISINLSENVPFCIPCQAQHCDLCPGTCAALPNITLCYSLENHKCSVHGTIFFYSC
jgi:hypothetical protein